MNGNTRALRLSAMLVAAGAAAPVAIPSSAHACQAVSGTRAGIVVVDIVCQDDDPAVEPFATSYIGSGSSTGNGFDTLTMTGGAIVDTGLNTPAVDGVDNLDPSTGIIEMLDGDDFVDISGGTIGTAAAPIGLSLGAGADTFRMSGGTITGSVFGLGGGNSLAVSGGTVDGSLFTGSGDDSVTISGTALIRGDASIGPDSVGLEDGNDSFTMTGGTLGGAVSGGNDNDVLKISGGTIGSFVFGNDGTDLIEISGGTILGNVDAERVVLTGGTIEGDISGISASTLIIDDSAAAAPIDLRNGALISGINAVGTILNTDLAAGGTKTLVFTGFNTLSADNSTLGFGSGTIAINLLSLANGSTLFVNGDVSQDGSTNVTGSAITLIDGAADDVFSLGGLALNNATIGLDLDQRTARADRVVANTLSATGTNIISINLAGTPVFSQSTDIPIIVTGGPVTGNFVASGLSGTQASLFSYQVISGPNGLFIRATPANVGIAVTPQYAVDAGTIDTAVDALDDIGDDAIDAGLGLSDGGQRAQLTPTFSVFASGQLAHTEHDGFTVSSGNLVGQGPGFGADDFSAAISLDFNLAKHLDIEDEYGVNLGLFGGYASTEVELGAFEGFDAVGDADNRGGMFGAYGLFRKEFNYLLIATSAFLGETDVVNGILDTTGSYDTEGYAVTGSAGHIFALGERMRFDLRGGVMGVIFNGADYTDSGGNQFGSSRISFAALKFEPGIYADLQLDNGMVISPYARADLQQRFGYENTTSIGGVDVHFDDADFSAALSTGFNLKMSKTATLSGEVRGKLSSDSSTVAGKLGLKIAF